MQHYIQYKVSLIIIIQHCAQTASTLSATTYIKLHTTSTLSATSGDLGKTSLIREAYEHQMVYKKFGCRAWVMLTSPFNPSEFFNSLLRQFYVYSREIAGKTLLQGKVSGYDVLRELGKMEESHVADQVSVCLEEKRYLIVIDGLTNIVEWDWIKTYFPDKKNGSRIIVSTQQVEVASLCPEQPYQVTELKQLSSDQSIYLFHNKVTLRLVIHFCLYYAYINYILNFTYILASDTKCYKSHFLSTHIFFYFCTTLYYHTSLFMFRV